MLAGVQELVWQILDLISAAAIGWTVVAQLGGIAAQPFIKGSHDDAGKCSTRRVPYLSAHDERRGFLGLFDGL